MKRNRTIPLNRSLILILIAISLPTLVYAECTLTLECGGGYGTRTMNFPDRSSCEAKLRETQNWLRSVGGGCDITNACSCEQSSEPTYTPPSYTPPSYDYEAERLRQEKEQKIKIEEQRKKEEEARRRQEEFERKKQEALKLLKGAESSEFDLKGVDTGKSLGLKGIEGTELKDAPSDIKLKGTIDISSREDASLADAWCKLNPPLYPVKPFVQIPDDQYERMMAWYKKRKTEWDQRCKEKDVRAANALPDSSKEPSKDKPTPKDKDKPTPLPIACSACWSNYDTDSSACATLNTNIERLNCVNSALDKWVICIGGCRSGPSEPVKIQK
jgi:hypothetical protein